MINEINSPGRTTDYLSEFGGSNVSVLLALHSPWCCDALLMTCCTNLSGYVKSVSPYNTWPLSKSICFACFCTSNLYLAPMLIGELDAFCYWSHISCLEPQSRQHLSNQHYSCIAVVCQELDCQVIIAVYGFLNIWRMRMGSLFIFLRFKRRRTWLRQN